MIISKGLSIMLRPLGIFLSAWPVILHALQHQIDAVKRSQKQIEMQR